MKITRYTAVVPMAFCRAIRSDSTTCSAAPRVLRSGMIEPSQGRLAAAKMRMMDATTTSSVRVTPA